MSRLQDAVAWATRAHYGQVRDGDDALPYVVHPLEVLSTLRWVAGIRDEDMLCAAALHDVLEETDLKEGDIRARMGDRVADLVKELTRTEPGEEQTAGLSKDEIYQLRSQMLFDEIRKMSPEAQIIKLCDRYSNLREAELTRSKEKIERYKNQTREILRIIPAERSPAVWNRIHEMCGEE